MLVPQKVPRKMQLNAFHVHMDDFVCPYTDALDYICVRLTIFRRNQHDVWVLFGRTNAYKPMYAIVYKEDGEIRNDTIYIYIYINLYVCHWGVPAFRLPWTRDVHSWWILADGVKLCHFATNTFGIFQDLAIKLKSCQLTTIAVYSMR